MTESTSSTYLDFEAPVRDIEDKIKALRDNNSGKALSGQLQKLRESTDKTLDKIYANLDVWQKVQVARHPDRPHTIDYIGRIFSDFDELHGDRAQGDDNAILGGLADFNGTPVVVMGHEKGRTTEERVRRNFGMAHPEGLRKANRLMRMAERFRLPVITFIDTAGAYPGIEGEERGQSEAIASNLALMSHLRTPIVVCVIGEGGSGGALAIGVGDRIGMMQHAVYSVATPESCASIIWRDTSKAEDAARAMKLNSEFLHEAKLVDTVIVEPLGGAHRSHKDAANRVSSFIQQSLDEIKKQDIDSMLIDRYDKIMSFGKIS